MCSGGTHCLAGASAAGRRTSSHHCHATKATNTGVHAHHQHTIAFQRGCAGARVHGRCWLEGAPWYSCLQRRRAPCSNSAAQRIGCSQRWKSNADSVNIGFGVAKRHSQSQCHAVQCAVFLRVPLSHWTCNIHTHDIPNVKRVSLR